MNSRAALCKALLDGNTLNIKNGFDLLGITNVPREIGRSVERKFDVVVKKIHREGKSRYGQPCVWMDYRLERTSANLPGIKKMYQYVAKQKENTLIKTTKQFRQLNLL